MCPVSLEVSTLKVWKVPKFSQVQTSCKLVTRVNQVLIEVRISSEHLSFLVSYLCFINYSLHWCEDHDFQQVQSNQFQDMVSECKIY